MKIISEKVEEMENEGKKEEEIEEEKRFIKG